MIASLLLLALAAPSDPSVSALQLDAPSINSASPELLDRAEFPARVGFAWDERLAALENRRAMTFTVTPLAAENLIRRRADHDAAGVWDRAALRLTLGGPPQFVDSLRTMGAGRARDHVTSELKLRLLDHRASRNESNEVVLALALDADNLLTGYGLDRYGATLIAEREARCTWTLNGGYRILERYQELHRLTETKLGLGTQWRLRPEWQLGSLDFGVSGACLLRNRDRPVVWQGGAIADLRAADGLRVSLGARRSNRPELRGDGRVRDVLSLSYDF